MGLKEIMETLPKESRVEFDENGDIVDKETKEAKEELPEDKAEEAEDEEAVEDKEENDEKSDKDDKQDKVSGYQKRKLKDYETRAEAAERRAQEAEARAQRMEQLALESAKRKETVQEQPKSTIPDPKENPEEYVKYHLEMGKKALEKLENLEKQQETQKMWSAAQSELEGLEKSSPFDDYDEVVKHAENAEVAKARILAPNMTEAQIRNAFKQDKVKAAIQLMRNGSKNVVEDLYNLMVQSYGYQKPAASTIKKDDAKNFDTVKKNKAKAVTPLAVGGRSGSQESLTTENAREISLAKFSKMSREEKDRIFGKRIGE